MRRFLSLTLVSVLLYAGVFGLLVDRPLSLGVLRLELLQKTARLAALPSPKLVILAGSNGPYSHSCAVLSAMLSIPCENGGIAVGIGLDDLFARYQKLLLRGDVVYMPMELQQYTASAQQYRAGVDGAFLLRHDRAILRTLPIPRIMGSVFCCTLGDFMEALAEMPLAARGVINPAALLGQEYNGEGDRIDNDLAGRDAALLSQPPRLAPGVEDIRNGYGTALIAAFVARETKLGVTVVGGMPVDFTTAPIPDAVVAEIAGIYARNGGAFLLLKNRSAYPPPDFFNSEDHLAKPCQYLQSMALAGPLSGLLHRTMKPPPPAVMVLAGTCPSGD